MCCRIVELKDKQVICIKDGSALGYVGDIEIDTADGRLVSIIIYGRGKFFGLFGREDDYVIGWKDIAVIGDDSILVNCAPQRPRRRRAGNIFSALTYGGKNYN